MSEENIKYFTPNFVDYYVLPDIHFIQHFGSVKLNENPDLDKYKYSGYDIGFYPCSKFSYTDRSKGKMSLFLELIWAHPCILITEINIL